MEGIVTPKKNDIIPPGTPILPDNEPSMVEPPMSLPRPSSERAQDVSHILAAVFKDLYTRDVMSKDTVDNLTSSSNGSNEFHKKCMQQLKDVHKKHKASLQQLGEIERHIIQSRARALSADEHALTRVAGDVGVKEYGNLGLPNVKSNFNSYLDDKMMKKHNLIAMSDIFPTKNENIVSPRKKRDPHYLVPTLSSSIHLLKGPFDDGYTSLEELEAAKIDFKDIETNTTLSSDSFELKSTNTRPHAKIKSLDKQKTAKESTRWRENMNHETRVEDRALLARLEERHNFLKNPRFKPPNESKVNINEFSLGYRQECPSTFIASPCSVVFSEWTVGRVYEAVLAFRNASPVSAQLRVVPPKTSFFSISLGKYPGDSSIIASGMSVKYNIRFMPDSLSDFNDEVSVVTNSGETVVVNLIGKRAPPILNIPLNIQCGHCLVGGTKIAELMVKNSGGSGRFCILKKSSWPAVNFKTAVSPGMLDLGPVQIRPAVFELLAGQVAILEVLFSPSEAIKYKENILIICDNCQVKEFTIEGEGQLAAVEIVSVSDGGESEPVLGECTDMTADHMVRFPPLNPHSFYMKQVIVHNSTNVEMPYEWHCLKPNLVTALPLDERVIEGRFEFYPDESMSFFIEPRKGVLQANGIHEFVLSFAPSSVGRYHNVLHMVLSNIPEIKSENDKFDVKQTSLNVDGIPQTIKASSSAPTQFKPNERPTSNMGSKLPTSSNPSIKSTSGTQLREVIALEIETKGESIPYSVLLHPPAIVIPGETLQETTVKRPFKMANYSLAPVEFKWTNELTSNIIEVEPPMGIIQPGDWAELEVSVTGSKCGKIESKLQCSIEHLDDPLQLSVAAQIKGPKVKLEVTSLDFGLVKVGSVATKKLVIRNLTQLHANWKLSELENGNTLPLKLSPSSGEILPIGINGSVTEVDVSFEATREMSLNTFLDLEVEGGDSSHVSITAEIQEPKVCFLESDVVLKNFFLSVPQMYTSVMLNQTMFPTKFKFEQPKGNEANYCDIAISPSEGIIGSQERLDITLTVSCHKVGELQSVFLLCRIDGMNHPIVLSVYANVQTLKVKYETPGYGEGLKVDFGSNVKIGEIITKEVVLINETSIRAPWSAMVEHFSTYNPPHPPFQTDFKSPRTRRSMLGRTPNLADPLSKTAAQAAEDHAQLLLKDNQGVAFSVMPSKGFLQPYQRQIIEVTVYSNMWGEYVDNLICKIESLPDKQIPIKVETKGCPLVFQMVAANNTKTAVVRFGSHITNGPAISRKMRILNRGPCDMQVDWRVFDTTNKKTDKKLVDVKIWFGPAFPKLDSYGKEIVPRKITSESSQLSITSDSKSDSQRTESSNLEKEMPKIVHVKINNHNGIECIEPFSITPVQCVIPAYGETTVNAVFTPGVNSSISPLLHGYANGYMTIVKPGDRTKGTKMNRKDGYNVNPLMLEMTASLRSAFLDIEADSEEEDDVNNGIAFNISIGDLLQDQSLKKNHIQYQNCTLKNRGEMALEFSLNIAEPFFMLNSKSKRNIRLNRSARNKLIPQDNLQVHLGFEVSHDTLLVLEKLKSGETVPGASLVLNSDNITQTLMFQDILNVCYLNQTTQAIPVKANVALSKFELSHHEINFGTCFTEQEECALVTIKNVGKAKAFWECELHYGESSYDTGLFRIAPASGTLEGSTSNISYNVATVNIYYKPLTNKECNAIILFKGILGESPKTITMTGLGSNDGVYTDN